MDPEYVLIRSWHVIRTHTRAPGRVVTLCGRSATTEAAAATLGTGRSCESCLRILARTLD